MSASGQEIPKPRGRPPKNSKGETAEWDSSVGSWLDVAAGKPKSKPKTAPKPAIGTGQFPRPRGRPPNNSKNEPAVWNSDTNEWVDARRRADETGFSCSLCLVAKKSAAAKARASGPPRRRVCARVGGAAAVPKGAFRAAAGFERWPVSLS